MDERLRPNETELWLRQALSEASLPAAPDTLRASLERLPAVAARPTISRLWWPVRALPLAVVVAVVVATLGIGLASRSAAPTPTASPTETPGTTASPEIGTPSPPPTGPVPSAVAVIPWVDAGPPPPEGRPTPRPVPSGTRTCSPVDLRATAEWQGATATMAGGVRVTNVSSSPCVLDGPPRHVVIKAGMRTMATEYHANAGGGPAGTMPPGPGLLEPGDRGDWWLFWVNWCGPALVPTTVVVTLPGGGGTIVARPDPQNANPGIGGTPRCDAPEYPSTLDATAFEYAPPEPPLPPEGQNALVTIASPPTATIGRDVIFTMAITNLGIRPAVFEPCPTYSEDLSVGGLRLKRPADRQYTLNCAGIGKALAPGATIVLEMHYPIPTSVAPGPAELFWSMDPGGPFDAGAFGRVPIVIVSAPPP